MEFKFEKILRNFSRRESGHWMQTEYDDKVLEYWKEILIWKLYKKIERVDGLDGNNDIKK